MRPLLALIPLLLLCGCGKEEVSAVQPVWPDLAGERAMALSEQDLKATFHQIIREAALESGRPPMPAPQAEAQVLAVNSQIFKPPTTAIELDPRLETRISELKAALRDRPSTDFIRQLLRKRDREDLTTAEKLLLLRAIDVVLGVNSEN